MSLRALVADDEPMALRVLAEAVRNHPMLELVATCRDGREALGAIRRERPVLVFLDIRMPELDGFEVLDRLDRAERPHAVFVTAYDEHALDAFRRHALAYLLKPFEESEFRDVVDRLVPLLRSAGHEDEDRGRVRALLDELLEERRAPEHVLVRSGRRTRLVPVVSIDWIEAEGNYCRLHCGTETHLVSETLGALVERLEPAGFARTHRSEAVNLDRVREFRTDDHRDYTILMHGGQELRLTRTYRPEVERRLGDRI